MKTEIALIWLMISLFPSDLFSNSIEPDTIIAHVEKQIQQKNYVDASKLIKKLQVSVDEKTPINHRLQSEVYRLQAVLARKNEKWEECENLLQIATVELKKLEGVSEKDFFEIHCGYAWYYNGKKTYDKALESFRKAEKISNEYYGNDFKIRARILNAMGDTYMFNQDYSLAAEYFLKYCEVVKDHLDEDGADEHLYYQNWGSAAEMYLYAGKVIAGKEIYLEVLKVLPKEKFPKLNLTVLSNLGYAYDELGDYEKAVEKWEEVVELNKKTKNINLESYNNLGVTYFLRLKDNERAKFYFNEVLRINDTKKETDRSMYSYASKNLSTLYLEAEGDKKNALKYINISLKSAMDFYGSDKVFTNEVFAQKGRILLSLGRKVEAEENFKTVWKNLNINLEDPSTYENNPHPVELFKVFLQESKAYYSQFEASKKLEDLERSNAISEKNTKMLELARASLTSDESKTALINSAKEVYEIQIKTLYALYEQTAATKYIEGVYELIEKTNNILLLEAVLKDGNKNLMGVPKEMLSKEAQLRKELGNAETHHHERLEFFPNDTTTLNQAKQTIYNSKLAYKDFLKELEADYPKYYQLNYKDEVVALSTLQKDILKEDQSLINFFMSDEDVFGILVSKTGVTFQKLGDREKIVGQIARLRTALLSHPEKKSKSNYPNLFEPSSALYDILIKPFEEVITKRIIIVPMAELSFIPFEILLKSKPKNQDELKSYPYMIKDNIISYGYSATLISRRADKVADGNEKKQFAGFAPYFAGTKIASTRSELVSLSHNRGEVEEIVNVIGGDLFMDQEASKENFIDRCKDYKILHLATHGVSNEKDGEFSYLAFTENSTDESKGLLYARDIYNLKLNADLVVLSACETAVGELQSGEGIISLARAFTYAGAKATVTTLWQLNDASASALMKSFYTKLEHGAPTDEALRNTKLDYMNNNRDAMAHPYYWSAFIPIGVMDSISVTGSQSNNYLFMIFGGIALLIFGGMYFKRR